MQANGAAESLHQAVVFFGLARLLSELQEPFAERLIEGPLLCPGDLSGLFDEFVVGTQGNVFHTRLVYTIPVYTAIEFLASRQCGASRKSGRGAQLFLYAQDLIVLGDAVGAGRRAGLDLAGAHGDDEVGDEGVLRFS
jgi:hypothetical protein